MAGDLTPLLLRTASRWGIPREVALAIIARDTRCVYCRREFGDPHGPRAACPSWEHIVNDQALVGAENIALCCVGCNASKGTKTLSSWLVSEYCISRGIRHQTIAPVAYETLRR